jgi:hypothetical protein
MTTKLSPVAAAAGLVSFSGMPLRDALLQMPLLGGDKFGTRSASSKARQAGFLFV